MQDPAEIDAFLEEAQTVFELAGQLGNEFEKVYLYRATLVDPSIWERMEPTFNEFRDRAVGLRQEIRQPPAGFEPLAKQVRKAAEIARGMQIHLRDESSRDVSQCNADFIGSLLGVPNPGPVRFRNYRGYYYELLDIAKLGLQAVKDAKAKNDEDRFSFLDEPIDDGLADSSADSISDCSGIWNSDDYRSVRWFGVHFSFTANQAIVVQILIENFRNGTPEVGRPRLLDAVDHANSQSRISVLFRDHPAWNTMIVSGGTKGSYRIADKLQNRD